MQEWNTFHTRHQDIPLRKWEGLESPGNEVESWLRVESSFFIPIYNALQTIIKKLSFTTHELTFMYSILNVRID